MGGPAYGKEYSWDSAKMGWVFELIIHIKAKKMKSYFYLDANQQQQGPVDASQLTSCGVTGDTYVWCEGMSNWTVAKQVPELAPFFSMPPRGNMPGGPGSFQQPYGNPGNMNRPCPETNLVWAILCTVLCCLPLGIVAILKANKVETYYNMGNYEAALQASQDARKWSLIGAGVSLVFSILYVLFVVIVAAAS